MNPEKIEKIFWLCIIIWFVLRAVLLGCQYFGSENPELRTEALKYFTEENINSAREYSLSGFWFKAIYGTLYIVILVALLRSGFFSFVWQKVTDVCGVGLFKRDLAFSLFFYVFLRILSFPSSIYFGYFRESASGFSNLTIGGWLLRYFKSAGINLGFEIIVMLVLLAVLRYLPNRWPWVLPLTLGVISAGSIILTPMLITPLFYNQKPLEAGELRTRILDIASKANLEIDEIYVIDESRYSNHTNAYFTGFGKYKRIVLYDNLIKNNTVDELALIFAHEAGHWKYSHMNWGLACGILGAFAVCFIIYWSFGSLTAVKWFGLTEIHLASSIPFFMIAYMVLQLFFAPIESQISQFMERQADRTSIELTGLNDVFRTAQIRLALDNKSELLPHPFRVFWLYSHPTPLERLRSSQIE